MLGYARRSTLHIKSIAVHRTLYLSLVRCYASQVRAPQSVELMKRMERIQRRTTKVIFDLLFIGFICDVSYSVRLEQLDLIPLCSWHEFLDLVFYLKCINGIINIHNEVLPSVLNKARATRSTNPDCLKFITPKCRTTTLCPGVREYGTFCRTSCNSEHKH